MAHHHQLTGPELGAAQRALWLLRPLRAPLGDAAPAEDVAAGRGGGVRARAQAQRAAAPRRHLAARRASSVRLWRLGQRLATLPEHRHAARLAPAAAATRLAACQPQQRGAVAAAQPQRSRQGQLRQQQQAEGVVRGAALRRAPQEHKAYACKGGARGARMGSGLSGARLMEGWRERARARVFDTATTEAQQRHPAQATPPATTPPAARLAGW